MTKEVEGQPLEITAGAAILGENEAESKELAIKSAATIIMLDEGCNMEEALVKARQQITPQITPQPPPEEPPVPQNEEVEDAVLIEAEEEWEEEEWEEEELEEERPPVEVYSPDEWQQTSTGHMAGEPLEQAEDDGLIPAQVVEAYRPDPKTPTWGVGKHGEAIILFEGCSWHKNEDQWYCNDLTVPEDEVPPVLEELWGTTSKPAEHKPGEPWLGPSTTKSSRMTIHFEGEEWFYSKKHMQWFRDGKKVETTEVPGVVRGYLGAVHKEARAIHRESPPPSTMVEEGELELAGGLLEYEKEMIGRAVAKPILPDWVLRTMAVTWSRCLSAMQERGEWQGALAKSFQAEAYPDGSLMLSPFAMPSGVVIVTDEDIRAPSRAAVAPTPYTEPAAASTPSRGKKKRRKLSLD